MGWCSGTAVFDPVVETIIKQPIANSHKVSIFVKLIEALQDSDWDCECDSDYWKHPLVREAFKKLRPDWDWKDIEEQEHD